MYKVHTHALAITYGLALHTILCGRFADRPNACPPPLRPVQSGAYEQYTPPPTHTNTQTAAFCNLLLLLLRGTVTVRAWNPFTGTLRPQTLVRTRDETEIRFTISHTYTHTHALSDQCARNRVDAGRSPGAHSHTSHMCVPVMAHHKRSVY